MVKPLCVAPMKINKIPMGKEDCFPTICASKEYFAQLKKDGYWYQFEKTEDNSYLWSRNVSVATGQLTEKGANVPHIMQIMNRVPAGTIIIGEIYYPGKRSKDVTPVMGSLPDKAIERQREEYGPLHYYVHDMIYYNGKDLINYGASIRYSLLAACYSKHHLSDLRDRDGSPIIELAARVDDNIQEACAAALAAGEEGMVLKKKTAPYAPGKRPAWDTIKIKKTDTCDAIIIGTCDPTREYTGKELDTWEYWEGDTPVTKPYALGWKTAIEIGCYDGDKLISIGTVSSGLTDAIRQDLAENPDNYIGKVCELAGMEKDREAHTLRHFHFKRIREDKDAIECTLTSIFG